MSSSNPGSGSDPGSSVPAAMRKTAALFKEFPAAQYNRLLPSLTIADGSGNFQRAQAEVVKIDPTLPERGKPGSGSGEVYQDKRVAKGLVALTRLGLQKFQHAAGIIFPPQLQKMEIGPNVVYCQACGAMKKADGSLLIISASKIVDLELEELKARSQADTRNEWRIKDGKPPWTKAELEALVRRDVLQARENMIPNAETKAQNRVIRKALALKDAYTVHELKKPFVLVRFDQVFDPKDPNQVQAALAQAEASKALLFPAGPSIAPGPSVLEASQPVEAKVIEPEEAEIVAEESVDPGTGEIMEEADDLDEAPSEEEDGPVAIIADYGEIKKAFKKAVAKLEVGEREKLQYSWRIIHRRKDIGEDGRLGAWLDILAAAEAQAKEVQR